MNDSAARGDVCARCGAAFHCGVNDDSPCACTTVTLTADTLAELRSRYASCLCMRCLAALASSVEARDTAPKEKAGPV